MSESQIAIPEDREAILHKVILSQDLSGLTKLEQVAYIKHLCESLGLNPMTKPFALLEMEVAVGERREKRLVVYALKDCTEQLRKRDKISVEIVSTEETDGLVRVTVRAFTSDGRMDTDIGAVYVKGLSGKDLANAHMKALTKAKRRVTLSICGLGILDESELDQVNQTNTQSYMGHPIKISGDQGKGLDQWACGRGVAMNILGACRHLEQAGITEAEWRAKLPEGITSRKELNYEQAIAFMQTLRGMWLDAQPKEGTANG